MNEPRLPELSKKLYERIKLVRRDMGDLLFHFTRKPQGSWVEVPRNRGSISMPATAESVLQKILFESKLIGGSQWTNGEQCICFTEAPIQEFNSIFSLVTLAASIDERPRYEPYGIAVSKKWFFEQGGRPVIYDHPAALSSFPRSERYRFVPYDPGKGIDFTWEREWRIKAKELVLDPAKALVIVPTSEQAFDFVYQFAKEEADYDEDGPYGLYHVPRWLAVSLDIFGFEESAEPEVEP